MVNWHNNKAAIVNENGDIIRDYSLAIQAGTPSNNFMPIKTDNGDFIFLWDEHNSNGGIYFIKLDKDLNEISSPKFLMNQLAGDGSNFDVTNISNNQFIVLSSSSNQVNSNIKYFYINDHGDVSNFSTVDETGPFPTSYGSLATLDNGNVVITYSKWHGKNDDIPAYDLYFKILDPSTNTFVHQGLISSGTENQDQSKVISKEGVFM